MWGDGADGSNSIPGIQADGIEAETAMAVRSHLSERGRTVLDVTESLLAWQADPSANHGWVFLPVGADGWDFESAEGGFAPLLTVNIVPEPSSLILLAVGALGLLAYRRRRG